MYVRKENPLKQGLRQQKQAQSHTHNHLAVRKENPLKQGLRLLVKFMQSYLVRTT